MHCEGWRIPSKWGDGFYRNRVADSIRIGWRISSEYARIYKTKIFHAWAEKLELTDAALRKAIDELLNGLHDTNLGGNL